MRARRSSRIDDEAACASAASGADAGAGAGAATAAGVPSPAPFSRASLDFRDIDRHDTSVQCRASSPSPLPLCCPRPAPARPGAGRSGRDNTGMASVGRLMGIAGMATALLGAACSATPRRGDEHAGSRTLTVDDLDDDLRAWAWHEQIAPACTEDEAASGQRACGLIVESNAADVEATIKWRYRMADPADVDEACRATCDARARELAWLTSHNRRVLASALSKQAARNGVDEHAVRLSSSAQLPYGLLR